MPNPAGLTFRAAVNGSLLAVPLLPLLVALGLAFAAWVGHRPHRVALRIWTIGPTAAATMLLAVFAVSSCLFPVPVTETLGFGFPLFRVGATYVHFALLFDNLAACVALPSGVAMALLLTWLTARAPIEPRSLRAFAAGNLLSAGTFLALLADNTLLFALGCVLSTVAAYALQRALHPATRFPWGAAAGELLLVASFFLLFWSFGGSWRGASSASPPPPAAPGAASPPAAPMTPPVFRVVVAPKPAPPAQASRAAATNQGGRGTVTLLGLPGVDVTIDQGTTAWQRTPFAQVPHWVGPHTLKIAKQKGRDEITTGSFRIVEGEDTRLVVLGPSFRFGDMAMTNLLAPVSGLPEALVARVPRWLRDVTLFHVVLTLTVLGCWLRLGASWRMRAAGDDVRDSVRLGAAWLPSFFALTTGGYLLVRLAFLWSRPVPAGVLVIVVLAAFSVALRVGRTATFTAAPGDAASPPAGSMLSWQPLLPFLFVMALASVALSSAGAAVSFVLSGFIVLGASVLQRLPWADTSVAQEPPPTPPLAAAAPTFATAALTVAPANLLLLTGFGSLLHHTLLPSTPARGLWIVLLALFGWFSFSLWNLHNRACRFSSALPLSAPAGVLRVGYWLMALPLGFGALRAGWMLMGLRPTLPTWMAWWYLHTPAGNPPDPWFARAGLAAAGVVVLGALGWVLRRPRQLSTGPASSR